MDTSLSDFQEEPRGFPPWPKSPAEHWHHKPSGSSSPNTATLSPSTAAPPGSFTAKHLRMIPEDVEEQQLQSRGWGLQVRGW